MPASIARSLYRRQTHLQNLEVVPLRPDWDTNKEPYDNHPALFTSFDQMLPLLQRFERLEELRISIAPGEQELEHMARLLELNPGIETLNLDFRRRWQTWAQWNVSEQGDAVAETLFPFLKPFSSDENFRVIKKLSLRHVDLTFSANGLAQILDMSVLTHLSIFRCRRAPQLLHALWENSVSSRGRPRLQSLRLYDVRSDHPTDEEEISEHVHDRSFRNRNIVECLDAFLQCFRDSLVELWVCLREYDKLPNARYIICHSDTLKRLSIDVCSKVPNDDREPSDLTYSLDDWVKICRLCTNLVQLGASFPILTLNHFWNWNEDFEKYWVFILHKRMLRARTNGNLSGCHL